MYSQEHFSQYMGGSPEPHAEQRPRRSIRHSLTILSALLVACAPLSALYPHSNPGCSGFCAFCLHFYYLSTDCTAKRYIWFPISNYLPIFSTVIFQYALRKD